jgi:hypothetical protein
VQHCLVGSEMCIRDRAEEAIQRIAGSVGLKEGAMVE